MQWKMKLYYIRQEMIQIKNGQGTIKTKQGFGSFRPKNYLLRACLRAFKNKEVLLVN